ncbi:MAG: glycosyltransferase family 39 protein [Isosphaeraceae bacterium]|nr:glycosyltransferase family 39 protein [Isosphaeraceae bacterium]
MRPPRAAWIERTLGIVAALAVVATLAAPGITIDEPLDVRPGRTYLATLAERGIDFFRPEVVDRVFADNAEHPPLGRWLLGIASKLGETVEIVLAGGPDPTGVYVRSGRLAPAVCFGLLIFTIVRETRRRKGETAAWAAGLAALAMPRLFAHAHLGALDLLITCFWVRAWFAADAAFASPRPGRAFAGAGLAFGLALLTKIHAWLLPPLIAARWVLVDRRRSTFVGIVLWGLVGAIVFVAGWPWLWTDPVGRLARFLGTGVDRAVIRVFYFGTVYEDRAVPWHYPWVHFAIVVPLGLQLLGLGGVVVAWNQRRSDPTDFRILAAIAYLLAIFSTSVAVYDGERLFLPVFPLWAVIIGSGFADMRARLVERRTLRRGLDLFLAAQFLGLVSVFPYGLSYYDLSVGGLAGAEALGLETSYWTEPVDGALLDRLAAVAPANATVALAPTLAPQQGKYSTTRALLARGLVIEDQEAVPQSEFVIIHRRRGYLSPELERLAREGEVIHESTRQGVWLTRLVRRPKSGSSP